MNNLTNHTPLSDSFTLFLYDFRLKGEYESYAAFASDKNSIWKRSSIKPDETYLFKHVRDFFIKNSDGNEIDPHQVVAFEIKKDNLTQEEKQKLFLLSALFSKTHNFSISAEENISFKLINDNSLLGLKLFICPLTSVGIFVFTFQLTKESNHLEHLINFNYKARIFSAGQVAVFSTPANPHPKAAEQEQKISEALKNYTDKSSQNTEIESAKHEWNVKSFVKYCMQDFAETSIREISPSRLQAFTYVQTEKKIAEDELQVALFRLRRMYNSNYVPAQKFLETSDELAQTFKEIYFGSSVEGGVILLNEDHAQIPPFLKNFSEVLKQRYLWTYLLAYHQRIALITSAEEVSTLYQHNSEPQHHQLAAALKKITTIQLKCMFNEISHYTQQNDFYYLSCKTLRLPQLFEELKNELTELNRNLTEEWRKEEEIANAIKHEEDKERDRKIAIVVGIFVVPQVWFALLATPLPQWQEFFTTHETVFSILTFGMIFTLVFIALKLFFFSKKK